MEPGSSITGAIGSAGSIEGDRPAVGGFFPPDSSLAMSGGGAGRIQGLPAMSMTGGVIEKTKASVEMPPINAKNYRSLAPQNMTIDITTKRSLTISEEPEEKEAGGLGGRLSSPSRVVSGGMMGSKLEGKVSSSSVRETMGGDRLSRVLRTSERRGSPQSIRGHTAVASSAKGSIAMELAREGGTAISLSRTL